MKEARIYFDKCVALLLIAATLAVSCALPGTGPGGIDSRALTSAAGRVIDENLSLVREYISADLPDASMLADADGYEIATRAMDEENGAEYLEFCLETSGYESAEEVFNAAEGLAPEEEIAKIREQVGNLEIRLFDAAMPRTRLMSPEQQEAFLEDLKTLVIKSAVLLTAAVVYSFVPNMIFWGKVAAASAVAIAAGVLATTIMAVVEYYRSGDLAETFEQWLEDVTTEPTASWMIASSMISIGTALNRSPVLTGVILGVFTLFNIVNDVKPMLEKYEFTI